MEWANKSRAIDPNKPHTWNGREASQPRGNLPKRLSRRSQPEKLACRMRAHSKS
jgi:hypothetical protein